MNDAEIVEGFLRLLEESRSKDLRLTLTPRDGNLNLERAFRRATQALKILDTIDGLNDCVLALTPKSATVPTSVEKWTAALNRLNKPRIACRGEDVHDALGQLTQVLTLE